MRRSSEDKNCLGTKNGFDFKQWKKQDKHGNLSPASHSICFKLKKKSFTAITKKKTLIWHIVVRRWVFCQNELTSRNKVFFLILIHWLRLEKCCHKVNVKTLLCSAWYSCLLYLQTWLPYQSYSSGGQSSATASSLSSFCVSRWATSPSRSSAFWGLSLWKPAIFYGVEQPDLAR